MKGIRSMKVYEIIDGDNDSSVGCIIYYERVHEFIIELQEWLDEWTAPLLFTAFVKKGIFTIPRDISELWVKERVIPSGRQNIGAILSNHKLKEYDEMRLLELSSAKCSQDSLYIKKIDKLPGYAIKRAEENITDCTALGDNTLLCFYTDGTVNKVDLSILEDIDGIDKVMRNKNLYDSCSVGTGGYSVSFNNSIDIPAAVLYERGKRIPLSRQDFELFVRKNVIDTSESCDLLECSRQNLSYMIKKEQISYVKEDSKGKLFLKGEVIRNTW